jgi:hypothetical protein
VSGTVAALFVRANSHYKRMPGVDAWDEARDARRWPGGCPVVAHPPCRLWGRLAQFARARDERAERQLALDAVEHCRRWGGVLEHPATSRLWPVAGLPGPGVVDEFGGWTLPVLQSWWGHRAPKATRLYIVGCRARDIPEVPAGSDDPGGRVENMCRAEREMTPPAFAAWLVEVARRCKPQR